MSETRTLTVPPPGQERLDVFLARECPEVSRSQIQRLITEGLVAIGGRTTKASARLEVGDEVRLTIPEAKPTDLLAQKIALVIVYQDEDLLVVDKPAGLAVHPAAGRDSGTLVNAVLAVCPEIRGIGGELRPGIVHRLDRDTSGLMVVAKNEKAYADLSRQIRERSITKGYLALAIGYVDPAEGIIDAPIGRAPHNRKRMAIVEGGREARTGYRVLEKPKGHSLLEVRPETGRTHQIRVHFASIGHPLAGDSLYGGRAAGLERHFLHADRLGFRLPGSGEYVEFESALPEELRRFLEALRL